MSQTNAIEVKNLVKTYGNVYALKVGPNHVPTVRVLDEPGLNVPKPKFIGEIIIFDKIAYIAVGLDETDWKSITN